VCATGSDGTFTLKRPIGRVFVAASRQNIVDTWVAPDQQVEVAIEITSGDSAWDVPDLRVEYLNGETGTGRIDAGGIFYTC